MEWTESLKRSINFMENHLLEDISPDDVAAEVHISSFYLQKGFSIMTGCSIGEYLSLIHIYTFPRCPIQAHRIRSYHSRSG